ncbi:MAG: hypothetical protein Q9168_004179 [Polycauliona sp. 1 TL-2023]
MVEDTLALSSGSVLLKDFALGVVNKPAGIIDQAFDGFIGLGFNGARLQNTVLDSTPTFFEAMMPRLESPLFALDFQSTANDGTGPSMQFGGINSSRFHGQLTSVAIDKSTNYWTAKDVAFSVHGQRMNESSDMFFDTGGGNSIYAPMSIVSAYYSQVPDLNWRDCTIIIPCTSQLPDLELHIGNGTALIPSDRMMGDPLTGSVDPSWIAGSQKLCIPTLQPGGGPYSGKSCLDIRMVGAPFFYENYVVFNQAEPSMSYAPYV